MRTTPKMGLFTWDQLGDNYSYAQLAQNFQTLDYHDHSAGRGPQIPAGGLAPGAVLSSNIAANQIGSQHFSQLAAQNLGINITGSNGRGYTSVAGIQTTAAGTPTLLSTPDQVQNISLTNGYLLIDYVALWKVSAGTATALVALNGTPVAVMAANGAPSQSTAQATTTQTHYSPLFTSGGVLSTVNSGSSDSSTVTTGTTLGASMKAFAAPGTYTVSVQFSVTGSNTVSVQQRQLWVRAVNYN